jgi:hypothetical protein
MRQEHLFDLGEVDVEAARDDHVLRAVDDEKVVVGIDVADVSGVMPAVPRSLRGGRA